MAGRQAASSGGNNSPTAPSVDVRIANSLTANYLLPRQRTLERLVENIRLEHKVVGRQHVFTSPDMPGLYVAHADYQTAKASVPSAVDMLQRMQDRRTQRQDIARRTAAG